MQQPGKQKKLLKEGLRNHDPEAAKALLAHSVSLGHERLAVARYLAAHYLGSASLDRYTPYCKKAVRSFKPQALLTLAAKVAHDLHLDVDAGEALGALLGPGKPVILPYRNVWPRQAGGPLHCGPDVSLVGRLEIGANAWYGPGAVVRADGHHARIGRDFRLGARSTVHIAHDLHPVLIGDRVTTGHDVVIHGCTVGDDCLLEDEVIILDGAILEDHVLVEAGSIVYPRSHLQAGWVHAGSPARPVRLFAPDEYQRRRAALSDSVFASIFDGASAHRRERANRGREVFIASTAVLSGRIRIDDRSGIYFGCRLAGHDAGIHIGPDCNVQDNSVLDAERGPVTIGAHVTIGHNVDMVSCVVGSHSLIGIGCRLAAGTIVDEEVLLAAGATTEPGQHLERGWLWGGRPARPMTRLGPARREAMAQAIHIYRTYGLGYDSAQRASLQEA